MPDVWKPQSRIIYKEWADHILEHGKNVTPWEQSFTKDVRKKLELPGMMGSNLYQRQAEILERIYSEKT